MKRRFQRLCPKPISKKLLFLLFVVLIFVFGSGLWIVYRQALPLLFLNIIPKAKEISLSDAEYLTIINNFENQFATFKQQIGIKPQSSFNPEVLKQLSQLPKETQKLYLEMMATDGPKEFQFLSNYRFLVNFQYPINNTFEKGSAIVEYLPRLNKFQLIKKLEEPFSSYYPANYLQWQSLFEKYGSSGFSPVSYVDQVTAKLFQMNKGHEKDRWVRINFNPFMMGLHEEKPEENSIYFGLYKNHPSFFVTNAYLRRTHNLIANQGIIKSFEPLDTNTINFKDLTNQHWSIGWSKQAPILDIPSTGRSLSSLFITIRVPEAPAGKTDLLLLDRHFTINPKDFTPEESSPTWVYGADGLVQQFVP